MDMLLFAADAGVAGAHLKVWAYAGFLGLVVLFLALDLGVFHREAHEVSFKEAAGWTAVWLILGLAFAGFVHLAYEGKWLGLGIDTPRYAAPDANGAGTSLITRGDVSGVEAAQQYLTGYVVEKSLAIDNIFVISLIFAYFAIPGKYQHRVLFWGILGALVMRGTMIFLGAALIARHQWVLMIFGGFLVLTAVKMALIKGHDDPAQNLAVRLCKRFVPAVDFYDGQRFFTRRTLKPTYSIDPQTGRERQDPAPPGSLRKRGWAATPLFLALLLVEVTDLVFAVDSIPAIFAITPDPFIVLTSNVFAMLGLRSLYFCLAAMIRKFRYLKPALILILAFVGVKLLLLATPMYVDDIAGWFGAEVQESKPIKIDTAISLAGVLGTLLAAVLLSVLRKPSDARRADKHAGSSPGLSETVEPGQDAGARR